MSRTPHRRPVSSRQGRKKDAGSECDAGFSRGDHRFTKGRIRSGATHHHFQAGDRCPIDWTQQLTNTPDLGEFGVAWSPDGTKLATLVSPEEYPEDLNPHVLRIHDPLQDGTGRIQLDPTSPCTDHSLSDEVDISLSDHHSGRTLQWSRVEPNILGFAALSYATGLLDVYRFDLGRGYPEKFSQLGGSGCVDGAPFGTKPCFFDFTNTPSAILRHRDDGIYSETPWTATPILLNGRTEYADPAWNPTAPRRSARDNAPGRASPLGPGGGYGPSEKRPRPDATASGASFRAICGPFRARDRLTLAETRRRSSKTVRTGEGP